MPRKKRGIPIHGWIMLDKPLGLSSAQAVARVRYLTNAQKIGHAGTLDPLASGVLPLALGEATKTMPYVAGGSKTYRFEVTFGEQRTTDDAEGTVDAICPVRPTPDDVCRILPQFTGHLEQRPPAYSALKIGGHRAYALARAGQTPDLPPRPVHIQSFTLHQVVSKDRFIFDVICGGGTYVRSLARDLAQALGTVGYVSALRRTRVGAIQETTTISLEMLSKFCHKGITKMAIQPIEDVLADIPAVSLLSPDVVSVRYGRTICAPEPFHCLSETPVLLIESVTGSPVALALASGKTLKPVRVFNL